MMQHCASLGVGWKVQRVCVRGNKSEKKKKESTQCNGLADAFISSRMGYISIPSSAVFLMKWSGYGVPRHIGGEELRGRERRDGENCKGNERSRFVDILPRLHQSRDAGQIFRWEKKMYLQITVGVRFSFMIHSLSVRPQM